MPKGKEVQYLAILQELEPNLLVLGLLIVHPYDESRKIGVFPRRVFLLKLQVFLIDSAAPGSKSSSNCGRHPYNVRR